MKKVILSALFSVLFVSMISAQETVVSEVVAKTEKACCKTKSKKECTEAKKAECKEKKASCDASTKAKKAECKTASAAKKAECKTASAAKKAECKTASKASCDMKDAKKSASVDGFACPMKCEKDKMYKKEGACPVCKMDLKKA
ncbi:MAG: hypothetical protein COB81_07095 [Flavobacteriaceae bacterium]|nr:MAG: hypothetical protein COB81_07095 [Flavobacteriaceae bacterium]